MGTSRVSKKYMHLNIKFDQGLPKGANGVFTKKNDGFSDMLETTAGGLSMSIFSSRAIKFNTSRVSKKYMHLNIKFDQGLPKGANGVFTELAGNKKLSEA